MDTARSITKSGWHPKGKDGGKESWRGDYKGINQVAGWVGKGKNPSSVQAAQEHNSRPLSTLKDPAAFGSPPKNVNYYGGGVVPNAITPDRRGLGAPLAQREIQAKNDEERRQKEAARKPAPPPVPYRTDRTGINPPTLPKLPTRAVGIHVDGREGESPATKPKPNLPPRLPPRQNSHPGENASSPPPTYTAATQGSQDDTVNAGAVNRLGQAGVSVAGLGIGRTSSLSSSSSIQQQEQQSNPWRDQTSSTAPASGIGDLQSRAFSLRANPISSISQSPTSPPPPAQGTMWQEEQAALKTASSFRNDPSGISMAEAKATATTANKFKERHGEQVARGWKVGDGLNKKYGIADRISGYSGHGKGPGAEGDSPAATGNVSSNPSARGASSGFGQAAAAAFGGFKKGPPPPPTRRITGVAASPPPVPLGSKPR